MAFKPNYRQQRNERTRVQNERKREKLQKRQEAVEKRKADREEGTAEADGTDESGTPPMDDQAAQLKP